jgi:hypothetical protein
MAIRAPSTGYRESVRRLRVVYALAAGIAAPCSWLACGARTSLSEPVPLHDAAAFLDVVEEDAARDGSPSADAFGVDASRPDGSTADGAAHDGSVDAAIDSPVDSGVVDASADSPVLGPPPLLYRPMSTARVSNATPELWWSFPPGYTQAEVQVCSDRACTSVVSTFTALKYSMAGRVPVALAPGVYLWRVRTISGPEPGAYSNVWQFTVPKLLRNADLAWGTLLDVNGDGYGDILAGDRGPSAYVYLGGPNGPRAPTPLQGADGRSLASAGDVNGDGFCDVIAALPGQTGAQIFYGGPAGLASSGAPLSSFPTYGFPLSVAGLGDVDRDGYGDVAIGVFDGANTGKGAVYIFFGGASGVKAQPWVIAKPSVGWGRWVAMAGDVNGDAYADFFVAGDPGITLLFGNAYQNVISASVSGAPTASGVAGAGDINGDGFPDVVTGGYGPDTAIVSYGSPSGIRFGTHLYGGGAADALATLPDVNGDGFDDILAATITVDAGEIFLGGAPLSASPATTLVAPYGSLYTLAGLGDVNGDHFGDFALGMLNGTPWFAGGASAPTRPVGLLPSGGLGGLAVLARPKGPRARL